MSEYSVNYTLTSNFLIYQNYYHMNGLMFFCRTVNIMIYIINIIVSDKQDYGW